MGIRVKEATSQVISVGALTMVFQRMLGLVCSKYLPAGQHGREGSTVSVASLSAFGSAVARTVWSKKLPMTNTLVLLNLLDGRWGSDPAFFIIWSQTRKVVSIECWTMPLLVPMDMAPIHLLVPSVLEMCFFLWNLESRLDSRWPSASGHDGWACVTLSECHFHSLATHSCCGPLQA